MAVMAAFMAVASAANVPICNTADTTLSLIDTSTALCSISVNLKIFTVLPTKANKLSFCSCTDTITVLNTISPFPNCYFELLDGSGKKLVLKSYLADLFGSCPGVTFAGSKTATSDTSNGSGISGTTFNTTGGTTTTFVPSPIGPNPAIGVTSAPSTTSSNEKSSSNTGTIIGVVVGVAVLLIAIAVCICVRRRKAPNGAAAKELDSPVEQETVTNQTLRTTTMRSAATRATDLSASNSSYLPVLSPLTKGSEPKLGNDPVISMARIPLEKIQFGDRISRGGYGEVYRGTYQSRAVAIKCLLPDRRRDMDQVNNFMAEIKLVAMLEHERIFMEGGDLRSLLDTFEGSTSPRAQGFDAEKAKIAFHIAHALTYLHTLQPPVVHRDLKSRNVLLSANLNAKLTDFGVSREQDDCTMTAAVGTSLWMAPEVLMGQRYNEKADVFSFGVLLSELDSHALPYAHLKTTTSDGQERRMPDVAIFQLVSLGKTRVQFSPACPSSIVDLAYRCVQLDAASRPSASEVLYELQRVLRGKAHL